MRKNEKKNKKRGGTSDNILNKKINMEIIPLKSLSKNEIDLFLEEISYFNIFHTEKILNYYFNTYDIDDKSFFVVEGKKPLAFAPLGISQEENLTSLSFSNVK